jgi:prenyltransferase beta subunit
MNRRRLLESLGCFYGTIGGWSALAFGQAQDDVSASKDSPQDTGKEGPGDSDDPRPALKTTPEVRKAIDSAIAWLVKQQKADGSFGSAAYRGSVAISSLAAMSLLASGSTSLRGRYSTNVFKASGYVLSQSQEDGSIMHPPTAAERPMYDHGFATLLLAELVGADERDALLTTLRRALRTILATQNEEGGWRYRPVRNEADISVTVCQMMALRAARNAGLHVPKETMTNAVNYVESCQNSDGGFSYRLSEGGISEFPRTAAAIVGLQSAGIYEGKVIDKAIDYVMQRLPYAEHFNDKAHYFYGQYYAALATWTVGGDIAVRWHKAIRETLLAKQDRDGSWSDAICREYATAMALLILQTPESLLPIFER